MTTTEVSEPDITCQRCGTRTPWAPYCPTCGAYLELAGVPAWRPGVPEPEPEPTGVEPEADGAPVDLPSSEPTGVEPEADGAPVDLPSSEPTGVEPEADRAPVDLPSAPAAPADVVTPDIVAPALTWEERQLARGLPFGMHWARRCPLPGVDRPPWWNVRRRLCGWSYRWWPLPALPQGDRVPPAQAQGSPSSASSANPTVARPMPQAELPRAVDVTQARTRALVIDAGTGDGDVLCPACRQHNPAGTTFCSFCGTTLPGAVVVSTAVVDADAAISAAATLRPSPPRRRDFLPFVLAAVAIAVIGTLAYLFLGPPQSRTLSVLHIAYRTVVEFINPYDGIDAPIASIKASSSLEGVSPDAMQDVNARTFWASAPSADYGAGTRIRVKFSETVTIDRIVMNPGIQNNQLSPTVLATPANVTLTFSDGSSTQTSFDPLTSSGPFRQVRQFDEVTTDLVVMTIDTVHLPSLQSAQQKGVGEVAISVLKFLQTPDSASSVPGSPGPTPSVPGLPKPPSLPAVPAAPKLP